MSQQSFKLVLEPGVFGICRLDGISTLPQWVNGSHPIHFSITDDECSLVCPQHIIPTNVIHEPDWRCLKVVGPLDFALTGVLASIVGPLSIANISIFSISTYDTDYFMVKSNQLAQTIEVLGEAGHDVTSIKPNL